MLTHKAIWRGIDLLAERNRLSASGLAKRAGLDPTTFNKSKRITKQGKSRWPSTESVSKILEATSTSMAEFVGLIDESGDGRSVPARRVRCISLGQMERESAFDAAGFPSCHTGALVGGTLYKKLGEVKPYPGLKDNGRFDVTKQEVDRFAFKVPSLRNIEKTAPYFHDGSTADLGEATVEEYSQRLFKPAA